MIKLPDTPAERINIGSALSFATLKTAIEQLVGTHGLPMVVEVTEVKPAGFLRDSVEGLVISHATEPRKYSKAVLTQEGSGLSMRLMVYYVGTDKYTRNMRAAEITRRDHAIMSGITRMLNADKAQQQEMYYEDMAQVVLQAIDMVQSGAVRGNGAGPSTHKDRHARSLTRTLVHAKRHARARRAHGVKPAAAGIPATGCTSLDIGPARAGGISLATPIYSAVAIELATTISITIYFPTGDNCDAAAHTASGTPAHNRPPRSGGRVRGQPPSAPVPTAEPKYASRFPKRTAR